LFVSVIDERCHCIGGHEATIFERFQPQPPLRGSLDSPFSR
jgi:hypothetical protein